MYWFSDKTLQALDRDDQRNSLKKEMDMMDVAAGGAGGSHARQTTASPETFISQHSPPTCSYPAPRERSNEGRERRWLNDIR